jgi:hypothetical protein
MSLGSVRGKLGALFRSSGRADLAVIVGFAIIHAIMLGNAIRHPPTVQYDAEGHSQYIKVLADARIPWGADTKEYFSPPIPYIVPAALIGVAGLTEFQAAKVGQFLNVALSAGLVLYLLALCDAIQPERRSLKLATLVGLALFPVYFRTFTMVRGEPFVALFAAAAAYHAYVVVAAIFAESPAVAKRHTLALGAALGLAAISRQWGLFLVPAVTLFFAAAAIAQPPRLKALARSLVLAGAITVVVGSWWYAGLYVRFGTVTAFNRAEAGFHFRNQPREFYTGSGSGQLFSDPIRPSFPNQLLPIFYSDTWGDYWGFFLVRGTDKRNGDALRPAELASYVERKAIPDWVDTNRHSIASYLGRVNLVAVIPSAFMLSAVAFGCVALARLLRGATDPVHTAAALLAAILLCTAAGYVWFLVKFPILGKGDTIKASYMLHVFPCVAALTGLWASALSNRSARARYVLGIAAALVILHNLPALVTRYG